jgi:hypothetical protein
MVIKLIPALVLLTRGLDHAMAPQAALKLPGAFPMGMPAGQLNGLDRTQGAVAASALIGLPGSRS